MLSSQPKVISDLVAALRIAQQSTPCPMYQDALAAYDAATKPLTAAFDYAQAESRVFRSLKLNTPITYLRKKSL